MMNTMYLKCSRCNGTRIALYTTQFSMEVVVMTNTTAAPNPSEVLTSLEAPRNEHIPR